MSDNGIRINIGLTLDDLKGNKDLSLEEQYGKLFPLLYDLNTREEGYTKIDKIFNNGYKEAGIVLGQYYATKDIKMAARYFAQAADEGIAEALWGLSGCLQHHRIPQDDCEDDCIWVKAVVDAAKLGCPDAMNEAGNIENRRNNYFLSAYWYGVAELYEHPQAVYGCKGIADKWNKAGRPDIPEQYRGNEYFEQGKLFIKTDADDDRDAALKTIIDSALEKDHTALKLFVAKVSEINKFYDKAFEYYKLAANSGDIYAHRACADMLMIGRGCSQNQNEAYNLYKYAAEHGEKNSCFVIGEFERNKGNKYIANAWYSKASVRGFEVPVSRLAK